MSRSIRNRKLVSENEKEKNSKPSLFIIYLLLGKLDNLQLDKKEDNQLEDYQFFPIFSQIQNQLDFET